MNPFEEGKIRHCCRSASVFVIQDAKHSSSSVSSDEEKPERHIIIVASVYVLRGKHLLLDCPDE